MNQFFDVKDESGQRLDQFLTSELKDVSRSYMQRLIKDQHVLVNNRHEKCSYILSADDHISVCLPDAVEPEILAENIPLHILYEDDDVLVVNKPKNMVVHPAAGHYSGTLVNALLWHCSGHLSGINGVLRPGIVHRIDKDTTGSLIVCKTDAAHKSLSEQLKEHSITRVYKAIVHGKMPEDEGIITSCIGRHPTDRKKMSTRTRNGKTATTQYRVLKYLEGYSYIECRLQTGRTHQIRVHMASIGHPVLGDPVYGPSKCPVRGLTGQTLHAETIGFIHPVSGKYIEVKAPLPEYFERLLVKLR